MPPKKNINQLMKQLERYASSLEGVNHSIEKNLEIYEKSISTSKELLSLLDRQKNAFKTLNKKAQDLFND